MKIRTLALLLIASVGVCWAQEMPTGWEKPDPKLTRQEFRRKDPNRFLVVTGDFNGDGVQDKALLL
ncbi:MAG: hypothetical protein ABSE96_23760, partial [Terracidiphilus sp.]